jgi:hypothetical protein
MAHLPWNSQFHSFPANLILPALQATVDSQTTFDFTIVLKNLLHYGDFPGRF